MLPSVGFLVGGAEPGLGTELCFQSALGGRAAGSSKGVGGFPLSHWGARRDLALYWVHAPLCVCMSPGILTPRVPGPAVNHPSCILHTPQWAFGKGCYGSKGVEEERWGTPNLMGKIL